jgi:DNA primase
MHHHLPQPDVDALLRHLQQMAQAMGQTNNPQQVQDAQGLASVSNVGMIHINRHVSSSCQTLMQVIALAM